MGKFRISGIILCVFCMTIISCSEGPVPEELVIVPEKTNYTQTSLYSDVMTFINALDRRSDLVNVEFIGKSKSGRDIPLVIIADPPVKSPEEAQAAERPVIYLQGNIHGGEVEGKEALMQIMRDIVFGGRDDLIENQVLLFCPIFNIDGNDKLSAENRRSQAGSPEQAGERRSGEGFDLNRDAVKLQSLEMKALVSNVLLRWDPMLLLDMHTTNGSWHGYSLTFAGPYTSTSHPGPQGYVVNTLLPSVRNSLKDDKGIETFWYGGFSLRDGWPPKMWHQGGYSANAWFLVNYIGLRNRMAVLSETFAHDPFETRIRSAKEFALSILEYTRVNWPQMAMLCRNADDETQISIRNSSGRFKKGVKFTVEPFDEPVDILVYDHELNPEADTLNTEQERDSRSKYIRKDNLVTIPDVLHNNRFKAVTEQTVPRGYIIPAEFSSVADKLAEHGIAVRQLESSAQYNTEEFHFSRFERIEAQGWRRSYVEVEGNYRKKVFTADAGSYIVDLEQPLAFLAFYMLEPEVHDGLVMWNYFDDYLSGKRDKVYPIRKYYIDN